jgi:ligand-binding sensor domain-containing protein/putative methionine-R-sulfoxide reductase with GAF domain
MKIQLKSSLFCFLLHFTTLFSLVFSQNSGKAQPGQFRFSHLTNENGLIHNTVYDILQDKYGFMWFATKNGVGRYDGYTTKSYKPTDFATRDVVDLVHCLETDDDGNLIFGTGFGIYFLDINKDSIVKAVNFLNVNPDDIYINNAFAICSDKNIVWVGTGNGLMRYDRNTHKVRYFNSEKLVPGWTTKRAWIKSLILDKSGMLFISTQKGIVKMNTSDFSTVVYNSKQSGEYFVDNDYFSSMAFDVNGRLWAGTLRKGVFCFDFKSKKNQSINFTGLNDSTEEFNEVKRLIADSKGYIWAGTQYTGLVRINQEDFSLQKIRSNILLPNGLSSDLISGLLEDRNGILWVGTYNNGVDRTNIRGSQFMHVPFSSNDSLCFSIKAVECFAEQNAEFVWVGTMKGLFRYNRITHSCSSLEEVTSGKVKLPHQSIVGIMFDKDSMLWIGTRSDVLVRVNLKTAASKFYIPDTTIAQLKGINDCRSMSRSDEGQLFFSFDNRLMSFNYDADSLERVVDKDNYVGELSRMSRLSNIIPGKLLVYSDYFGTFSWDLDKNTITQLRSPDDTKDKLSEQVNIKPLRNGGFLLSDYNGLYELDQQMNFKQHYTTADGLSDNKICNIETDTKNRGWMSTYNGISVFDPSTKSFRNYFVQDGLAVNEFRESKSMQTADGTIFFGTHKGFTYFNPDFIRDSIQEASVFFTSFKIMGKEVVTGMNLNAPQTIRVPSGSNFFSISFASMGFHTIHPAKYQYQLEGVDQDWLSTEGLQNSVNYTNIDGGTYLFKVKSPGNNTEVRYLQIQVGYVFYKTWWFRGLLILSMGGLIFWFIRLREKQILKGESEKTIDYFANSFYGKNSVDEILWDVCRNCISRLGFQDAVVYLLDEKRNVLVQKAAYGPKNPKDFEIVHPLEIPVGNGIVGAVAASGQPILVSDTTKDSRYIADDDMRLSELSVPIVFEGKVIGVIDSEHSSKRFFTKEHLRLLSTIASICSTKIARALLDQQAADRERVLLEIGKKVAETRLMALRAQMNPHFIFNSLNAIQECIVKEKVDEAQKYLIHFSRLLRMVIDNSELNSIPLDKELAFIQLYLELESLRFGQSFKYTIEVSEEIDPEEVFIPSLIVQPFIENAIWHGLLHKEGIRELSIEFKLVDEEHLIFTVTDNGIGRKKASEIKSGGISVSNHQSKGMRITQERIELVRLQTRFRPKIEVTDLFDSDGNASGTRVTVTLPLDSSVYNDKES